MYTFGNRRQIETPMYVGGLSKELEFQEVLAMTAQDGITGTNQTLGQLGGKGVMTAKHKGGKIIVKAEEYGYVIGLVSITPRIEYTQGNKWDTNLENFSQLHVPPLDAIGFQDLVTDKMAWFDTVIDDAGTKVYKSAGKQPAWIDYQTNYGENFGSFAEENNEEFMVLNRRYDIEGTYGNNTSSNILDLTTYIDPAKYNYIFAQTSRDAMNYWVNIYKSITARRVMSAKIIPNL